MPTANGHLQGGSGPTVEVGGTGKSFLEGGQGRNLLIAGQGNGHLKGHGQGDILIGGSTDFDANEGALSAIMAEWASANSYATRVNNLRTGGGANGAFTLDSASVIDDGLTDLLRGDGGLDWFLFGSGDKVKDRSSGELVN